MRKLICCLLALTVVLSLLAVPAFASSAPAGVVTVKVSSTAATAGGNVTLTFTVENPSALPIAGIEFSVTAGEGWGEPTASYPCAGKYFEESLVSFNSGVFRATGVLNGMNVTETSWEALKLTYKVPEGVEAGTTYSVSVSKNLLYDGDLADQTWGESGPFTFEILDVILGDVDGSGVVDMTDAIEICKLYLNQQLEDNAAADFDQSGTKDLGDAIAICEAYINGELF